MPDRETASVPVDRCPWCEDEGRDVRGRHDTRVLVNGRGTYICPENPSEHRWRDADERIKPGAGDLIL